MKTSGKRKAITIGKLSETASDAVKARNAPLFSSLPTLAGVNNENAPERTQTGKTAIAPKRKERAMTKTEERFIDWLRGTVNPARVLIIPQPTRLFRFDDGDTYTPDVLCIEYLDDASTSVTAWEVKGGYRGPGWEQGYERYKRARERFGQYGIAFRMATWEPRKLQWRID